MKRLVLTVGIAVFALGLVSCPNQVDLGFIDEAPALSVIWADHFPLGNIISPGYPVARMELLARHFDILTAENHMKPSHIQASPGGWNFGPADGLIFSAQRQGIERFHGHTLVWHSQSPQWLAPAGDRAAAIRNLENYIETVMRHFDNRVESWDVLNEVIASWVNAAANPDANPPVPALNADNWRTRLRVVPNVSNQTNWHGVIGSDPDGDCFIWLSFTTARRVADEMGRPDMILYYNDYNEEFPGKRRAIYYMVREMNERFARENNGRRLIDAVGMQAHYHRGPITEAGETNADANWTAGLTVIDNVRDTIQLFASLGVYVSITELDLTVGDTQVRPLTPRQEREQAIMYARLFQVFRDNSQYLRRVSIWGLDDPSSWRWRGSPVLFDGSLRPKEAFWAVADPDAFVDPVTNQPRTAAQIDAFLENPQANGSGFIPANAWDPR